MQAFLHFFAQAPTTPKILFTSARDGNYEIYSMNPDGSEKVNLTQHRANDVEAVWSPTGEQILFVSDRKGKGNQGILDRDLYLMDPDGSNVRRVFKREASRDHPTWSPNGKRIAYEYIDLGTLKTTIHIATLGKQEEEPVVKGFYPAWSPDGTEIAYTTYLEGIGHTRRITLIDIHTRKQKLLLPKKAMDWQNSPFWSSVGEKLVFSWNKNPLPPDHNPLVDPFLMNGRIRKQSIVSTETAPNSNNSSMKPVPLHGLLRYRQTATKSSIHKN